MKIRNIFKVVAITVLILVIALGTVFLNARVFAPKAEATKKTYAVGDVANLFNFIVKSNCKNICVAAATV